MVNIIINPRWRSWNKCEQLFFLAVIFFHLENHNASKKKTSGHPIIKTSINLSIPNIVMKPSLDEVQQTLNEAVDSIVKVMKGVGQWSKERISKVCL